MAARLRTLPLSISGILMGTALAISDNAFNGYILIFALLTTIGFQITSNFANDYGDGVKGTDNEDRIGPSRALQSGLLTKQNLKTGILISSLVSLVFALSLLYIAFGLENIVYFLIFTFLGILSIWAAIRYTMGSKPYGYQGLGDLAVFVFFGLLGVLGSLFLYTKSWDWVAFLPAMTIGFLCVGVLNLNNLRDVVSDEKSGKNTLVVQMGFQNGKTYHFVLILCSFLALLTYSWIQKIPFNGWLFFVAFVPITLHLIKVMRTTEPVNLDGELKKLALSTFLLSVLFLIAVNYFL
ncbi:MAG: 1,4-dihydroxy-2-naphthoate octaprenyltransferase [Bacteroidota bacterium]